MKLYIYEHCPYCVKARMIFGYKNINVKLITLLNDDEETPRQLVGQKIVPILEPVDGKAFSESLDIINYIDQNFGDKTFLNSNISEDNSLNQWLKECRDYLYPLAMPRWIKIGLEEFSTESALNYFKNKKEDYIGSFKDHEENSSVLKKLAEKHLIKLSELLVNTEGFYSVEPSINDIHLYPTLRSLSVVKDLVFPQNVLSYMLKQEELTKVPLHISCSV